MADRAETTDRAAHTLRGWSTSPDLLVGRMAGAGLLFWMAWIHLHLWNDGYKHLPSIGYLFVLNFVAGVVLAGCVLAAPRRVLAVPAGAGALLAIGTLVSLILSINVGLLGFQDGLDAPFVHLSIWVEAAAAAVLAATAVRSAPFLRVGTRRVY